MTNFPPRHNPHSDDASRENDLDTFLNHIVASDGPPDASLDYRFDGRDPESLLASADAFHRRMKSAHQRHPESSQPVPDLWGRILKSHTDIEKETEMSTTSIALESRPQRRNPIPRYIPPATVKGNHFGLWANAIAAAMLVLVIGAGAWFSGYGPGGSDQGGDPTRFAAQVGSPEATPSETSETACNVEPLTTEQIVAYVENPYSYMPHDAFGTPAPGNESRMITEGLMEPPRVWMDVTQTERGQVPSASVFDDAYDLAEEYYACFAQGTLAQVWALMNPAAVQQDVLSRFPVYRSEGDVLEHIESVRDLPMDGGDEGTLYADESRDGRGVYANPNIQDARVFELNAYWMLQDADMVLYIGQESRDENEETVSLTDWDTVALSGSQERLNGTSLILVHSESTDRWFVEGFHAPTPGG